jgi:hypothetical protein
MMHLPIGTLVNAGAVILGGSTGVLLRHALPERYRGILFQGLGLCTLALGTLMIVKMTNPIVVIASVLVGGLSGELLRLEEKLENGGNALKKMLHLGDERFTEGLVTAFLVFCVGSMTILGAIDEGIRGDRTLYFTKSILDGFCSIALAATWGAGVIFSVIPLLVYQGGLTLLAAQAAPFFTPAMTAQLTATGGVLVLGIGLNLLGIAKIRTSSLLPSLVIVALFSFVVK